ncbi:MULTISPECIES: contractile injection system protein, VgrG/Pvc8 family [Dickeya]|uniref:Gene D protein n=1 Tax=Dickeya aquatica TaxID=1401087 RepID=A0A375ABG5_9GAMM|nr:MULTISPECIES: contractile injection system protein, VgrG/Pvc8 family [Dickeya]SLM63452.1 Gene D protein [Dickeya aquatica]
MIVNNRIGIGTSLAPDVKITLDRSTNEKNNASPAEHTEFKLHDRLVKLSITDNAGTQADQLTLTLDDSDGRLLLPERGQKLIVSIGWKNQPLTLMGSYCVDTVKYSGYPTILDITAHSVDFRGSFTTPIEASYHDTTLGDIARTIAERNNLFYSIDESLSKISIISEHQSRESDVVFISRLAKKHSGTATVKKDTLILFIEGKGISSHGDTPTPYSLERSDGDKFEFELADRPLASAVVANWHSTSDAKTHNVKISRKYAAEPRTETVHPAAKTPENNASTDQPNYTAGNKNNQQALQQTYASQQEAMQAALSRWREIQRQGVKLSVDLAKGVTTLKPGGLVRVKGFKNIIDEKLWSIKTVVHNLNAKGFLTSLTLEIATQEVEYTISYDVNLKPVKK